VNSRNEIFENENLYNWATKDRIVSIDIFGEMYYIKTKFHDRIGDMLKTIELWIDAESGSCRIENDKNAELGRDPVSRVLKRGPQLFSRAGFASSNWSRRKRETPFFVHFFSNLSCPHP
jgi:hypothetical protein